MKKLAAIFLSFSLVCVAVNAQSGQQENATSKSKISSLAIGGFFNFEPAVGDLSDYMSSAIGGGLNFEMGLPIAKIPLLNNFGLSFKMAVNGALMKDTVIDSLFNMRFILGAYTKIPLGSDSINFVPEINYGVALYFPKVAPDADSSYVKSVYADQVIQLGLGFRFTNQKMLKGNLELELTPTYTLSPEEDALVHYFGVRAGFMYKFKK